MAVVNVSATSTTNYDSAGSVASGITPNINLTVNSGDTALLIFISFAGEAATGFGGTWGTQTLSVIQSNSVSTIGTVLLGCINPTSGAQTLTLTWSGGSIEVNAYGTTFIGTGNTIGTAFTNATGTTATSGTTLSTSVTSNLSSLVAAAYINNAGAINSVGGTELYIDNNQTLLNSAASYYSLSASVSATFTTSTTADLALSAVCVTASTTGVMIDAIATADTNSGSSGTTGPATLTTLTVGSEATAVAVFFSQSDDWPALDTVTVTWGSQTMTLIQNTDLGSRDCAIFGLINPTSGNQTVTVTWSSGVSVLWTLFAMSFTGTALSVGGAFQNNQWQDNDEATPTETETASYPGCVAIAAYSCADTIASVGGTELYNDGSLSTDGLAGAASFYSGVSPYVEVTFTASDTDSDQTLATCNIGPPTGGVTFDSQSTSETFVSDGKSLSITSLTTGSDATAVVAVLLGYFPDGVAGAAATWGGTSMSIIGQDAGEDDYHCIMFGLASASLATGNQTLAISVTDDAFMSAWAYSFANTAPTNAVAFTGATYEDTEGTSIQVEITGTPNASMVVAGYVGGGSGSAILQWDTSGVVGYFDNSNLLSEAEAVVSSTYMAAISGGTYAFTQVDSTSYLVALAVSINVQPNFTLLSALPQSSPALLDYYGIIGPNPLRPIINGYTFLPWFTEQQSPLANVDIGAVGSTTTGASETTATCTLVVPTGATAVLVLLSCGTGTNTAISGISGTVGSSSLTVLQTTTDSSNNYTSVILGLVSPASGSQTVSVSWTTSASAYIYAVALNNTATTLASAFVNGTGATADATSISATVTNVQGGLVFGCTANNAAFTSIRCTGWTLFWGDGGSTGNGAAGFIPWPGTNTMAFTLVGNSTNEDQSMSCITVAPAL